MRALTRHTLVLRSRHTRLRSMAKATVPYKHTHSYLQVLGNGTDTGDTLPSVLLFFDAYRYVFNVGEGFQRYCFQHRLKIGKLNDVFLTRMSTEGAGGVPGLFITLSESSNHSGAANFNISGPMKLDRFLEAIKTFVNVSMETMRWMNFGSESSAGALGDPLVSNSQVEIRPILLLPKAAKLEGPFLEHLDMHSTVPAACYVCRLADVKGRFLPDRAKALGVTMGPDCSKLVSGQSVTTSNGDVVHPDQVMEPTLPGPIVIIVDCPDDTYMSSLFSASGLEAYEENERDGGEFVMVHLASTEIVQERDYVQWLRRFGKNARHIYVNEEATEASAIMRRAATVQSKLHLVDPLYFPLPKTLRSASTDATSNTSSPKTSIFGDVVKGRDLLRYHLKPLGKAGIDESALLPDFDSETVASTFTEENPHALPVIDIYKKRRQSTEASSGIASDECEVVFLGTGAALPSSYRNVTSIYLDFFDRGSMLLDCGEGSYGQLVRRYGREGAMHAIKKLKCIWISHIHADHHIGLPTILRQRRRWVDASTDPLLVLGPPPLYPTMQNYEQLEPMHFVYRFSNEPDDVGPKSKHARLASRGSLGMLASVKEGLNLASIDSFLVDHCYHAYGVSIVSRTGWKIVFSGDTIPCRSVVEHAKEATLLIHEATFEEDMKEEALYKKHSTVSDAVSIAKQAGAYRTILTHFSQRYPKIPVIEADASAGICMAFDLMSVNLSDLEMLPYTIEPCKELFQQEQGEDEETTMDASIVTSV